MDALRQRLIDFILDDCPTLRDDLRTSPTESWAHHWLDRAIRYTSWYAPAGRQITCTVGTCHGQEAAGGPVVTFSFDAIIAQARSTPDAPEAPDAPDAPAA